jgi:phosphopantetheinyl transferase (holo-ACP synthase)
MSDTNEYAITEVDPITDGQVESVESEPSSSGEEDYFSWDEYADRKVKLPVAGEEIEVPLKEALSGYQRQADYTRKTQELSQERQQLQFAAAIQQALDSDPQSTIELLKEHYNLNEGLSEEEDIFADPMERQYRQLESRIKSFEEQRAYEQLENNINSLQTKYGEGFDANEVISKALATGTTDLEGIYKQIAFDKIMNKEQALSKVKQEQVAKENAIVESKRQMGVVSGGTSAASASTQDSHVGSLRDAFDLAKRQLGIS